MEYLEKIAAHRLFMATLFAAFACSGTATEDRPKAEDVLEPDAGVQQGGTAKQVEVDGAEVHGDTWILPVEVGALDGLEAREAELIAARLDAAEAADLEAYLAGGPQRRRIFEMLREILSNDDGIPSSITRKLRPYTVRYSLNHGPVEVDSGERMRPSFIPGELAAAAQTALLNGASLDLPLRGKRALEANRVEELELLLEMVRPAIFGRKPAGGEGDAGAAVEEEEPGKARRSTGFVVAIPIPDRAGPLDTLFGTAAKLDQQVRKVGGSKSASPSRLPRKVRISKALLATGDLGPILPGDVDLYGRGPAVPGPDGEVLFLSNLDSAFERAVGKKVVTEFSPDPVAARRRLECRPYTRPAMIALREIGGRGADGTEKRSAGWLEDRLGDRYWETEELRADLAALFLSTDGRVAAAGVFPETCVPVVLEDYVVGTLEAAADARARKVPGVEARMALVAALLEGGGVELSRNEEGALSSISVVAGDKAAQIIVRMLAEVRRVRFAGDRKGAAQLLDPSGAWLSSSDRVSLRSRWKSLGLPDTVAFGYPRISSRRGEAGQIASLGAEPWTSYLDTILVRAPRSQTP